MNAKPRPVVILTESSTLIELEPVEHPGHTRLILTVARTDTITLTLAVDLTRHELQALAKALTAENAIR